VEVVFMKKNKRFVRNYCMNCANGGELRLYETEYGEMEFCSELCVEQFNAPKGQAKPDEKTKIVAKGIH
jgi:hypothetical protein